MSVFTQFYRQCQRNLLLQWRQPSLLVNSALFFIMITAFFPLALPFDPNALRTFAPGIIWISVLLTLLLASERLFQQDYDDGVLEQSLISGQALAGYALAKLLVQWLLILLPLLLFCPILALMFGFTWSVTAYLLLILTLGTPSMLCLCALAAAFSTGLSQKGVVMALIVLPLTIPVMIIGSMAVTAAMQALPLSAYLALLLALALLSLSFLPLSIAAVLRIGLSA